MFSKDLNMEKQIQEYVIDWPFIEVLKTSTGHQKLYQKSLIN